MQLAAALGQKGDSVVGHLTPGEEIIPLPVQKAHPEIVQALAKALQEMGANPGQYQVGSPDEKINPQTGMPQFDAEDSAGNNMSDPNNSGGGGYSVGSNDTGGSTADTGSWQTTGTEMGPAHAQDVNAAFAGDPGAMGRQGWGPSDSGIGAFGITGARNYNPMTNNNVYGFGFNPGRALGGLLGGAFGGPLGGMALGYLGSKLADTSFGFPDVSGEQKAPQTQPNDERNGAPDLMAMMQPQQVRRG